jgi:hypothetical protein
MKSAIHHEWEAFASMVLPPDAPMVQRRETHRAFVSGALSALQLLGNQGQVEPRQAWANLYSEADEACRAIIREDAKRARIDATRSAAGAPGEKG